MQTREWSVEEWPPHTGHGMRTGRIGPGIRVTHCPSGLSETCTEYRSQHQNRDYCIRRIKQALKGKAMESVK